MDQHQREGENISIPPLEEKKHPVDGHSMAERTQGLCHLARPMLVVVEVITAVRILTMGPQVITQIWLNTGVWISVLFGNRWRSTKIFGYDPAAPFGEGLEQDSRPYPSDADLLLLLNGIVTTRIARYRYLCVWTPTRVKLLVPLAFTVCLSYSGTGLICGGPNDENPLSQSVMLILLVCMVISGKVSLEKNVRQEYVAFNISVRKRKLLEHTVRKFNNSDAGGGPTTKYEKAFADIRSALNLLEGFSGSIVHSGDFVDSDSRGFRSSDVVEVHSLTRDTQHKEQITGILNQNSTPNQLNKEWTLMTGGKVTLNATSSYMGDITAKAYGMLQTAGQDYNLNLIELQDSVLPNMPILQFIATQVVMMILGRNSVGYPQQLP
ncbi:Calcium/calmodulin-dependent 3',5'-cyclic nucleotide phosphodiesterase 1B [Perkinsus olseni]|uniref:Calcium/calmodulin-dependent 3',5'-cyclic nucleotide phosphodiesterase 1B n=1 Tax=Perkinsus olseni TaxID=32597 RepID=A0A7J6KTQ2_PEROL|nr:Calcium/calmodulin-dependent 3',5'-cyclic nucleotide phosphodiesterase 1B [Perkinsus olseni]KAF4651147.1 Calcium/calmodulin-dependent 3',5'-cyclic nucleotide phosphodiesterase 1B [Perkinsus olseni]